MILYHFPIVKKVYAADDKSLVIQLNSNCEAITEILML